MLYSIDIDYDKIEFEIIKHKIELYFNDEIIKYNSENQIFDYFLKNNNNILIKIYNNKYKFSGYDHFNFKKADINVYNKLIKNRNIKNQIFIFTNFLNNDLYLYKYEKQNADNKKLHKIFLNNFINII